MINNCIYGHIIILLPQRFPRILKQSIKVSNFLLIILYLGHAWTQTVRLALSPARPQSKVIVTEGDGVIHSFLPFSTVCMLRTHKFYKNHLKNSRKSVIFTGKNLHSKGACMFFPHDELGELCPKVSSFNFGLLRIDFWTFDTNLEFWSIKHRLITKLIA